MIKGYWFEYVEISYFMGRDNKSYLLEWWKDLNSWVVYRILVKEEIYNQFDKLCIHIDECLESKEIDEIEESKR